MKLIMSSVFWGKYLNTMGFEFVWPRGFFGFKL